MIKKSWWNIERFNHEMLGTQNPRIPPLPSAVGATPLREFDLLSSPIPRNVRIPGGYPSGVYGYVDGDESQPFHIEGRELMRREVLGRLANRKMSDRILRMGGSRNQIPKPQPTGSFARPLNTSGNQNNFADTGRLDGMGGGFRTKAGSRLGIDLIRKRGEQFEVLDQLQPLLTATPEEGLPNTTQVVEDATRQAQGALPPGVVPSITRDQAQEFGLDIMFNTIVESTGVGEFSGLIVDDLRRAYQTLASKAGLQIPLDELQRYYAATQRAIEVANGVIFDTDRISRTTRRLSRLESISRTRARARATTPALSSIGISATEERFGMNTSKYTSLWRLDKLVKVLIDSFNLQPRERGILVRSEAKRILREKPSIPGLDFEETGTTGAVMDRRADEMEAMATPAIRLERAVSDVRELADRVGIKRSASTPDLTSRTPETAREAVARAAVIDQQEEAADDDTRQFMFGERPELDERRPVAEEAAAAALDSPYQEVLRQLGRRPVDEEAAAAAAASPTDRAAAVDDVASSSPAVRITGKTLKRDILRMNPINPDGVKRIPPSNVGLLNKILENLARDPPIDLTNELGGEAPSSEMAAPDVGEPERRPVAAAAAARAVETSSTPSGLPTRMGTSTAPPREFFEALSRMPRSAEPKSPRGKGLGNVRVMKGKEKEVKGGFLLPLDAIGKLGRAITGRGVRVAGRPTKYTTAESKLEARRVANQVLRKKKTAYKKSYDKAIAEGLNGDELDARARMIFQEEFGFQPSAAFPFGPE